MKQLRIDKYHQGSLFSEAVRQTDLGTWEKIKISLRRPIDDVFDECYLAILKALESNEETNS